MPSSNAERVWFITGSSAGFGRLLVEEILRRGERVVATARKLTDIQHFETENPGRVKCFALDVTKAEQVAPAVEAAIATFGRIDVLVNNAGFGTNGTIEETSEDEFMPMFETNVFGLIRTTKAVLPIMRKQRFGHIINLSSIAGLIATPGISYYAMTKFAVEALSEGLAGEVKSLGIHVTAIEPGPFRTEFLGRSATIAKNRIADYEQGAGAAYNYFATQGGKQTGDPQKAIEAIITIADSPNPPLHLILGKSAHARFTSKLAELQKSIAEWEFVTLGADFPEVK